MIRAVSENKAKQNKQKKFLFFSVRVSADEDLTQFMSTVLSLLREVESEMDNVRSNQQRAEFYANRLLCALRHLSNILAHMQHAGGYPPVEVQEVQTLHGNIKAIYILIVQLPIMQGYSYRPQTDSSSGPGRPRYRISLEQLSCLRSEFNSWTQIASDLVCHGKLFTTDAENSAFQSILKVIQTFLIITSTLQFLRNSEPFLAQGRQM